MSRLNSGKNTLEATQDDVKKLLSCKVHIGTKNVTTEMERYVHSRRKDGIHIISLDMTWEKLMLAARIIVAVENPADVCVMSARPYGQRAVLKFCNYTNCTPYAGRVTPGTFTNHHTKKFIQPRVLIVTDPRTDHQPLIEASYANIPVIALCDTDSPLQWVDVAIPCNNRGRQALAMMYWMLGREVLRMRGTIPRSVPWSEKVDLFLYRDPDEVMKKETEVTEERTAGDYFQTSKVGQTFEKQLDGVGPSGWGDDTTTWEAGAGQWAAE